MVTQNALFTGSYVYRQDHILGLVEDGLSAELYRSWGYGLGRMLLSDSLAVVSSDIRASSLPFKAALIEGLISSGVRVIDLGVLPMDVAAYANDTLSASCCVCVTGDWHSARWNGLRWHLSESELSISEQVERLKEVASGSPVIDLAAVHRSMPVGRFRKHDITFHWIAWAQDVWHDANQRQIRVLVDTMHGSWSGIAGLALRAIFPHVHFETIRDIQSEGFGGVIPNSRILDSIVSTCRAVRKCRVDFGVSLDADAGNFTIIDNEGNPLSVEEMQWLFIRHLLCDALEGECLLYDAACSEVVINEAIRLGAKPIVSGMSSDCFISNMRRTNAILGITSEGGLYFRGTGVGRRIVVFAISWVIDYMLCATFKLSDWRKTLPAFYITPELRVSYGRVDDIVKHLSNEWMSEPMETVDGYNFSGTASRVHIRLIVGYDQVGFRFESRSREGLDNIIQRSCIALSSFGEISSNLSDQYKQSSLSYNANFD
ncbi:MAG: hypothetical protein LBB88_03475 [Planctomycetaceae bacterium]|jgi:phosphomannomutase|nr:hypothetical protein [Planctomycetaceae bacterium]